MSAGVGSDVGSDPSADALDGSGSGLTRYTPGRPLLLLTDYPPDAGGGGAVILRSLLGGPDRSRVVWASLSESGLTPADPGGPTALVAGGTAATGRRRSVLLDSTRYAGSLARGVEALADRVGARAVWVVAHGAAVHVAARLIASGRRPLHLTVHDDPAFANALRSRRYLPLVPWVERDFAASARGARSVDVIGEGMRDRYRRRYGVEAAVVHRALAGPLAGSPPYDRGASGLAVGVLGSTYAYRPLRQLAEAVRRASGRLGVRGRVVVIGRGHGDRLRGEFRGVVEVEAAGHLSEPEGVERLGRCFALYLNYPFGWRDAVLRRTSFPTKLSTYVQAARPLLVHAPADSSVAALRDWPDYAGFWQSIDPDDGAELLTRLWRRPGADGPALHAAEAVRLRYFEPARNRSSIAGLLNALVDRD